MHFDGVNQINYDANEWSIHFYFKNDISNETITQYKKFLKFADFRFENEVACTKQIVFRNKATHHKDKIHLILQKPASFHNVNKLLVCDKLEITNYQYISDSLLGLFKFDGLMYNYYLNNLQIEENPKWWTIFIKHYADKNVAACQTDLFKNGFKTFAKS